MKPLLKCPYPVDCWGREMRITLSILIAERINQLRKSRKLSVNKLATMSGLSYSTLNSILRGKSKSPTLGTLIRIASALNMTILEFLNVPEIVNFSYTDVIRIRATKIGSFRKKYACTQRKSRRPRCGSRLSASEQLGYFAKKYV